MKQYVALDVGGAHIKVADGCGCAAVWPFPLWQRPTGLVDALESCLATAPTADVLAVTMTGELADCYETKAEGVAQIVAAVERCSAGRPIHVYCTDGQFRTTRHADEEPLLVAAANWHALAQFVCRYLDGAAGLLVDIGSTTTDIVPLDADGPAARGTTDPHRLVCGELVYTGVVRSPVCGLVETLPWQGQVCPTAQEVFATTGDAYVTLGDLPEDPRATYTADGRGLTRSAARDRLARSICADRTMFSPDDALAAAEAIRGRQLTALEQAARRVLAAMTRQPKVAVIGGLGEFLARDLIDRTTRSLRVVSLVAALGPEINAAATAHAVAVLAREARLA
jgi:probable H4MPT-linked C1 transfer pathway protein